MSVVRSCVFATCGQFQCYPHVLPVLVTYKTSFVLTCEQKCVRSNCCFSGISVVNDGSFSVQRHRCVLHYFLSCTYKQRRPQGMRFSAVFVESFFLQTFDRASGISPPRSVTAWHSRFRALNKQG